MSIHVSHFGNSVTVWASLSTLGKPVNSPQQSKSKALLTQQTYIWGKDRSMRRAKLSNQTLFFLYGQIVLLGLCAWTTEALAQSAGNNAIYNSSGGIVGSAAYVD